MSLAEGYINKMRKSGRSFKLKVIALAILITIAVSFFALYFYSEPGLFSRTILINTNQNSLVRFFSDDDKTARWLKTRIDQDNRIKIIKFRHYYLTNAVSLEIKIDNNFYKSKMQIIPAGTNSSYIRWQFDQPSTKNPITRVERIIKRNTTARDMQNILFYLKEYTKKIDNIYGYNIKKARVKDTLLVVTKSILESYPGMPYVYRQIGRLRQFLTDQRAQEKNFPMLYVFKTGEGRFETTIAIPVNREIKSSRNIVMQRMVAGDILWAECKGGPSNISKSFAAIENYMQDYQKSSPAQPFELLVTDRLKEPDTLKWVTRIYYPMY